MNRRDSKGLLGNLQMAAQIGAPAAAVRAHEELFAYWASLREAARLPGRADIDPGRFQAPPADRQPDRRAAASRATTACAWPAPASTASTAARSPASASRHLQHRRGRLLARGTGQGGRGAPPGVGVHNLAWRGAAHLSILWLRLPLATNGARRRHDPGLRRRASA